MTETASLFDAKELHCVLPAFFDEVNVEVSIPALHGNHYVVGGDWGPDYTIALLPQQSIIVTYRDEMKRMIQRTELKPASLLIESPMLHEVRKSTPWCYHITDHDRRLAMALYVDKAGECQYAELMSYHLPSVVIREPVLKKAI